MKVLVVSEHFPPGFRGGSATYLDALVRELVEAGHEVAVVAGGPESTERRGGAVVHRTGLDPRGAGVRTRLAQAARTRARVATLLERERFDLLHLNHTYPSLGALLARSARALPTVATFYAPFHLERRAFAHVGPDGRSTRSSRLASRLGYGPAVARLDRALFRRARRVVALSEYSRTQACGEFGLARGRVDLVPGGVDPERFRPPADRAALRHRLGLPHDGLLLVTVRRLDPRMGLEELVRAVALLRERGERPHLLLVGGGRLAARLSELARELGVGEDVRLLGEVEDEALVDLYGAADLFVLPSRALEAFGLSTVEALACGVPALGTAVGGTPEILRPLDPRLLVDDPEPETLARAIARVRREGMLADGFRAACRRHAVERFSWSRARQALERSYRLALESVG